MKRLAEVPLAVKRLGRRVSKADLLEAAYWLAALACESCDDEAAAFGRLLQELNTLRVNRGAKKLKLTPLLTGKSMRRLEQEANGDAQSPGKYRKVAFDVARLDPESMGTDWDGADLAGCNPEDYGAPPGSG